MIQKIDCRFLIGLPGSGKSTYRKQFVQEHSNYVVISTDDMIDEYADQHRINYNEAWQAVDMKQFEIEAKIQVVYAVADYKPIIIDRTNLSQSVRKMFSELLTNDYKKTAVIFSITENLLNDRLHLREQMGKIIPFRVIQHMKDRYVEPTNQEFDDILHISYK